MRAEGYANAGSRLDRAPPATAAAARGRRLPPVNARAVRRTNVVSGPVAPGCTGMFRFPCTAALLLAASLAAGGCATLTTGSSQTVTIVTEPAGAACVLRRDGEVIGAVNPTPGSIAVGKSHGAISVHCARDGFRDAEQGLTASFQAATLGNVLLGGLIGIVVDAASGATASYEPQLLVLMVPAGFDSAAERDRFFAARSARLVQLRSEQEAQIKSSCRAEECERLLKRLDESSAAAQALTERQRAEVPLRSPT